MDIRRAISHAGLRDFIRWFAERAPRDGLAIAHGANVSIDSDQALGDTITPIRPRSRAGPSRAR